MLTHRFVIAVLLSLTMANSLGAQQRAAIRIGYISAETHAKPPAIFRELLQRLGYLEGKNINFEYRTTGGRSARNGEVVTDILRSKVDILVVEGTSAVLAAKKATAAIPIVMIGAADPVGTGIVASLAHPGGNVTGVSSLSGELGGKLLDLLKETQPGITRVVIPGPPPGSPSADFFIKETEPAARALKIRLIRVTVRGREDYNNVFRIATKERAQALLVRIPTFAPIGQRKDFVELAAKKRLPAIYQASDWVDMGGLLSYGPDRHVQFERAAVYVDKILKGARPTDIPVEQPMKLEFVVNLKTAKQMSVTIPPNVLVRADRVIR